MQIINLYKYERESGKITVSPIKPEDKPYTEMFRLVADEGMTLTYNGMVVGAVIDTDSLDGWAEVEKPEEPEEPTEELGFAIL